MSTTFDAHLISTKEASELSGYNPDYLARLCRSGKLVGRQIGRAWLIDERSLTSFVHDQEARKEARAQELSRQREAEYRSARMPAPEAGPAHVVTTVPVRSISPRDLLPAKSSHSLVFSPATAFALSIILVGGIVYAGNSSTLAELMDRTGTVATELATSEAVTGPVRFRPYTIESPAESATAYLEPARISYAVLPRGLALADAEQHLIALAPASSPRIDFERTGELQGETLLAMAQQSVASGTFALSHPASMPSAFIALMQEHAARIQRGELRLIGSAGNQLLAVGASVRDTSEVISSTDPAGVVATHVLDSYANGVQGIADAAPRLADTGARAEVALGTHILATGDTLTQLLGTSAAQAPGQAADLALGAAGNAVLGAQALGAPSTQPQGWNPNSLLALTVQGAPWYVPQPVYSIGSRVAISVYGSFHGLFDQAGRVLAMLFGNPQTDTKLTVVPFSGTTAPQAKPSVPAAPVIIGTPTQTPVSFQGGTVVKNEYVTNNFYYTGSDVTRPLLTTQLDHFASSLGHSSDVSTESVTHVLLTSLLTVKDFIVTNGATVQGALTADSITATNAVNGAYFIASVTATSTLPKLVSNSFALNDDYFTDFTGNGLVVTNGTLNVSTTSLASGFFLNGGNTFGGTALLGTADAHDLQLVTNGAAHLTVAAAGNIGVGTANPQAPLDVRGTLFVRNTDGSAGSNDGVEIATDASAPRLSLVQGGRYVGLFSADAPGNTYLKNTAGGDWIFTGGPSGGTELGRLTNAGKLGIGTTSPSAPLSVAGNGLFSGDLNFTSFVANGGGSVAGDLTAFGGIGAGQQNSNPGSILAVNNITSTGGQFVGRNAPIPSTPTYSWTGDLTTGVTHPMNNAIGFNIGGSEKGRFDSSGFFGIGTTTPVAALSVNGDAFVSNNLTVGNSFSVVNGSVTLGSATSTLTLNGSIGSNLIPAINKSYDLGSPALFWRNGYLDSLTVNTLSAASTSISGTVSNSFTLNSDNASNDTEDANLIFFRGVVNPNAVLSWNSTADRFEFNQPGLFWNQSSTTTIPSLIARAATSQTADLFQLQSSTGTTLSEFTSTGALGIGTTTPAGFNLYVSGSNPKLALDDTSGTGGPGLRFRSQSTNVGELQYLNTENRFRIFAGGTNAVSERFTILGTNGNVGIGTTTPWAQLSVNPNGVSGPEFAIGSSSATHLLVENSGVIDIGTSTSASIGGDLNLTNTNLTTKFINLNGSATGLASNQLMNSVGDNIEMLLGGRSNVGTYFGISRAGLGVVGGSPQTALAIGTRNATPLIFAANNLERARIDTSGNFGIGTTSPSVKLHVESGTGVGLPALNTNDLVVFNNAATGVTNLDLIGGAAGSSQLNFGSPTLKNNGAIIYNNSTNAFTFNTNNGARVTIDSSGNVGIGTTSPSTRLALGTGEIALTANNAINFNGGPSSNTQPNIYYNSTSNQLNLTTGISGSALNFNVNGNPTQFSSSGGVGIGTTTPWGAGLTLAQAGSQIYIESADTSQGNGMGALSFINKSGNKGVGSFNVVAGVLSRRGTVAGAADLVFQTAGPSDNYVQDRLIIKETGNVGIGTTSPWAQLSINPNGIAGPAFVVGSSTATQFEITNGGQALAQAGSTAAPGYSFIGDTNTGLIDLTGKFALVANGVTSLGIVGSNITAISTGTFGFSSSGSVLSQDTSISRLSAGVVAIGNGVQGNTSGTLIANTVGIGTTTPWAQLSVNPTSALAGAPEFVIGSSSATHVVVDGAGRVGIGLTSPTQKLDIASGGSAQADAFIARNRGRLTSDTGITALDVLAASGIPLSLGSNGVADRLVMDTSGNVGIGTTTPNARLQVYGTGTTVDLTSAPVLQLGSPGSSVQLDQGIFSGGFGYLQAKSATAGTAQPILINPLGGNVAIGTTSAPSNLYVSGSTGITFDSNSTTGIGFTLKRNSILIGQFINASIAGATSPVLQGVNGRTVAFQNQDSNANITSWADTSGNILSFVKNDGSFSIGTSTLPTNKLVVGGSASFGADYNVAAPTNGLIVEGNVGIGTTSPMSLFSVLGTASFASDRGSLNIIDTHVGASLNRSGWKLSEGSNGCFDGYFNIGTTTACDATVPAFQITDTGAVRINNSQSLTIGGNLVTNAGSASSPSHTFTGDTSTGLYDASVGTLGFATAGAQRATLSSSGLSVNGSAAFGGTSIAAGTVVQVASNANDPTTNIFGGNFSRTLVLTANNSNDVVGGSFNASLSANAFNETGVIRGGQFQVQSSNTATVSTVRAGDFLAYNTGVGTITNAYGGYFTVQNLQGAGVISNAYGTYVGSGFNNGTISNFYGVYVDTLPPATTTYGFYENSTANNFFKGSVGIGSTTPASKLSISVSNAANVNDGLTLDRNSGQNAFGFRLKSDAAGTYRGALTFTNTGTELEALTVDRSGNIGIGTSTPNLAALVVTKDRINGSVYTQEFLDAKTLSTSIVGSGIVTAYGGDSGQFYYGAAGGYANGNATGALSRGYGIWSNPTISSAGVVSGTPNFYVSGSGSVGIGTTSPFGKLSISGSDTTSPIFLGDALTGYSGNLLDLRIASSTRAQIATGAGASTRLRLARFSDGAITVGLEGANNARTGPGLTLSYSGGVGEAISFDEASGYIGFYTNGNNTERARIDSSGNFGLGTTSPSALLAVHANNGATQTTLFSIGSSTASATTTLFSVLNTGNVGIGTAAPGFALDVAGKINTDQYSGFYQNGSLLGYASTTNADTIFGFQAGGNNATTSASVRQQSIFGFQAGNALTTGGGSTAFGYQALLVNKTGSENIGVGPSALVQTTADGNTAIGAKAGGNITTGLNNIAIGRYALSSDAGFSSATGNSNVAIGTRTLSQAGLAASNVAIGDNALKLITNGSHNLALGIGAGFNIAVGDGNLLFGENAGQDIVSGGNNIVLGAGVTVPVKNGTQQLNIANVLYGTNISNSAVQSVTSVAQTNAKLGVGTSTPYAQFAVQAVFGSTNTTLFAIGSSSSVSATSTLFQVSNTGQLQFGGYGAGTLQTDANGNVTVSSDERLKDINGSFTRGLADLQKLNPILFHWNAISGLDQNALNAGFSAQNVQSAIPEAVGQDKRGYLTLQDRPILAAAVNAIKDLAGQTSALSQATSTLSVQLADVQAQAAAAQQAAAAAAQLPAQLTATRVTTDTLAASGVVSAGSVESAGTVKAGSFTVPSVATQYLIGSSTVAVNLPSDVLAAGGDVDLYKLATYTLASVQNLSSRFDTLSLKIDDLETRLAKLESATSTPGILPDDLFATSTAQKLLASVGFIFENGFTEIRTLVADTLTVGTAQKPTGVTLYDEQTGAPYCVSIKNGQQQITSGACQVIDLAAQQAAAAQTQIIVTNGTVTIDGTTTTPVGAPATSTTTPSGSGSGDTTPPSVTLNGSAAVEITTGSAWNDPGATATDTVDGDLTGAIKVTGAVNVNAPGLYTVTYSATDAAGNTGTASRTVVVKDPSAAAVATTDTSTTGG